MHIKIQVIGATAAAISIWLGPVQTAYGIISPNMSTAVTEIITAA